MDTLFYYKFDLYKKSIPEDLGKIQIRKIKVGEEEEVRNAAKQTFQGYFGHYHADSRLPKNKADEIYIDWAYRSSIKEAAEEVLVAVIDGKIVGFATLQINSNTEGEGVLFGVIPAAQRKGIYRSFIIGGLNWCKENGMETMVVSTQITNIAVQKVWSRVGFEPYKALYTFHKWFV
jgi:GNAT superfamily N-acetyltransferase